MRQLAVLLPLCVAFLGAATALAEGLPSPEGRIVLEVDGRIGNTNRGDAAVFDLALLERFGGHTFATETAWSEDEVLFEGISGPQLLAAVAAEGESVRAVALNDYSVEIPVSDFREAGLLIAYKRNGAPMSVRDKGPLWIVFPYAEVPEDERSKYEARSVWQLKSLTFR